MLKFFKKMERTRNILLLIFALVLVGSLIVFYAPTEGGPQNLSRSEEVAAQVGSEEITIGELLLRQQAETERQNLQRRQFGAPPLPGPVPVNQVIERMIPEKIGRLEAARLGLTASDGEVAEAIREIFKPEDGQKFDRNRYEQNAIRQAGSVAAFEESLRDQLSQQKLIAYVTSGVSVSEEELLSDYKRSNTKFDLTYVPVNTADLIASINPSDDELKKYFEENKKSYSKCKSKSRFIRPFANPPFTF